MYWVIGGEWLEGLPLLHLPLTTPTIAPNSKLINLPLAKRGQRLVKLQSQPPSGLGGPTGALLIFAERWVGVLVVLAVVVKNE